MSKPASKRGGELGCASTSTLLFCLAPLDLLSETLIVTSKWICLASQHKMAEKVAPEQVDSFEAKSTDSPPYGEVTWTEAEETRVRRKLDLQIVPMVTVLYLM